jgi:hypothetical protein
MVGAIVVRSWLVGAKQHVASNVAHEKSIAHAGAFA